VLNNQQMSRSQLYGIIRLALIVLLALCLASGTGCGTIRTQASELPGDGSDGAGIASALEAHQGVQNPASSPDTRTFPLIPLHVGNTVDTGSLWRIETPPTPPPSVYLPLVLKVFGGTSPTWWKPPVKATWQWQLTDAPIDRSFDVDVYDIDLFDTRTSTVAALHVEGRKVFCYVSVGSWEDWRPDADQFPESIIGNDYEGWPGEKWLDIRQIDLLAPIIRARFDLCQAKGFDGIEPDNVDGFTNDTGFPLTYQDQLEYNMWLADEAHARGLSIGLKNDDEQAEELLPHFDWAMTEDCFADDWCDEMEPFITAGEAVFAAEYTDQMSTWEFFTQVCPEAEENSFSVILKNRDLDAWRRACP
jgi:endo-alpha-1,4-polygalactosaminidase (GH114 family)